MNMVCAFRTRAGEWLWLGGRARAEARARVLVRALLLGPCRRWLVCSLGGALGASRSGGRGRARSPAGEERARAVTASASEARDRSVRDHRASWHVRDALATSPGHAPERVRRGGPAEGGHAYRCAVSGSAMALPVTGCRC